MKTIFALDKAKSSTYITPHNVVAYPFSYTPSKDTIVSLAASLSMTATGADTGIMEIDLVKETAGGIVLCSAFARTKTYESAVMFATFLANAGITYRIKGHWLWTDTPSAMNWSVRSNVDWTKLL